MRDNKRAIQRDRENFSPFREGHIQKAGLAPKPRIGHQNIHAAHLGGNSSGHAGHFLGLRYIGAIGHGAPAPGDDFIGHGLDGGFIRTAIHHNGGAISGEPQRDGAANILARACDQRDLARKRSIHERFSILACQDRRIRPAMKSALGQDLRRCAGGDRIRPEKRQLGRYG